MNARRHSLISALVHVSCITIKRALSIGALLLQSAYMVNVGPWAASGSEVHLTPGPNGSHFRCKILNCCMSVQGHKRL